MMNIEIHQPRVEALLQQRMASGQFANVEDAILHALERVSVIPEQNSAIIVESGAPSPVAGFGRALVEVLKQARDFAGELDITRDPSPGRVIDLS